ncbi:hypothetical protein ACQPZF_27720 [Actinosynnema sp. CS-041913]|uniref:hypothetical protein n=1 Tax=Actinosynnema sp. CS-041913 TaxID=3239917 RepID=UPI003D92EB6B
MPNPRHRFAQVRDAMSVGVRQALGAHREGGPHTPDAFARAMLAEASLTEHYHYRQEISRNRSFQQESEPTGRIDLTLPYDGAEHFTRQALADVTAGESLPERALIGHLALGDHSHTDLSEVLDLSAGYGSVPITVPIAELGERGLVADRSACEIRHDYTPADDALRVRPVDVHVDLIDPDGTELHDLLTVTTFGHDQLRQVGHELSKQISFRSYLRLSVQVVLHLPNHRKTRDLRPKVGRVSLRWPTITSLGALSLEDDEGRGFPIGYDPAAGSIEWRDVPMFLLNPRDQADGQPHGDTLRFASAKLHLHIEQPGELYKQPDVQGTVQVEVDDYLLSGLRARLFDARGVRVPGRPRLTSRITTDLSVILDDAFNRRLMMPGQHLYFDEVIPDDMRVSDIRSALEDKGFEIKESLAYPGQGEHAMRHLLWATRAAGPDVMQLWLLLEGRRFQTERQNQLAGGQTFKTTFDSGDLKVFMCGALPGTSRELTHVMNALQLNLRELFERLKAHR